MCNHHVWAPPRTSVLCPKCRTTERKIVGPVILPCPGCGNTSFNDTDQLIGLIRVEGKLMYTTEGRACALPTVTLSVNVPFCA